MTSFPRSRPPNDAAARAAPLPPSLSLTHQQPCLSANRSRSPRTSTATSRPRSPPLGSCAPPSRESRARHRLVVQGFPCPPSLVSPRGRDADPCTRPQWWTASPWCRGALRLTPSCSAATTRADGPGPASLPPLGRRDRSSSSSRASWATSRCVATSVYTSRCRS